MKKGIFGLIMFLLLINLKSQNIDSVNIVHLFQNALVTREAYNNLEHLCKEFPGRIVGSKASFDAVDYLKEILESKDYDTVFLQRFEAPAWECSNVSAELLFENKNIELNVVALGPSASTPTNGLTAEIIEVKSLDEVKKLGNEKIKGKIVFYNRRMKPTFVHTFEAYGDAIDQRYYGPLEALKYGAVGVIVRSMTHNMDDYPHTGSYFAKEGKIPAIAISTNDADKLSNYLVKKPDLKINLKLACRDFTTNTYNLIADIKGNEFPDEYIVVAGHIDSWHNTEGAHDDGVGCMHAMEVLRLFKETGIENKRTIRAILYMDEEIFQSGANAYLEYVKAHNQKHIFALESDGGGFAPKGFTVDAPLEIVAKFQGFQKVLNYYGIYYISQGWGGVDIGPLKEIGIPISAYNTDSQRYYDIHHCSFDKFANVHFREMQIGSGNIASLIYLVDKYSLK